MRSHPLPDDVRHDSIGVQPGARKTRNRPPFSGSQNRPATNQIFVKFESIKHLSDRSTNKISPFSAIGNTDVSGD